MTTLSSETIQDTFFNNGVCPDISHLSEDESIGVPMKSNDNVSVMQIQVSLPMSTELVNMQDKRLSNVYITLPMVSVVKYSMNYTCRLCGEVIDESSAVNIFSEDQFQNNLVYKINKYLPIVIYETDPFPKIVCKECVDKLNQFHDMVQKCVIVEEQLRQTYVFDERYLDEVNKKVNEKSSEPSVQDNELYPVNDINVGSLINNELNMNDESEKCAINSDELMCRFCQRTVIDENECAGHLESHYDSLRELQCLFCDHVEESKMNLDLHVKTHFKTNLNKTKNMQPKPLKKCTKLLCCRKCRQNLDSVDLAVEHCIKHKPANIKFYPCVLCIKGIGKSRLKDHVMMHYPTVSKTILSCDNCNNLYPDEKTLKYHRCSKLRKFKCSQCKQGFKSEDRLKFHEDFHRNKSTYCDICKKDFKFESRIYLHFAGVHNGIREKPYCCDVCGKTFTWLTLLNSHKRTHTNERPYKCTKCDARFCNKYSLDGHMPSHEDHPQMYCDKCDYHTGRKQNLQNHISRFHKEISSSQNCIRCTICNEIFPNKHHLVVEDHKHTEAEAGYLLSYDTELFEELTVTKLYQCERCERCFSTVDHLTQHRTTHVSSDVYQCRLCDVGFAKHDLLVKHRKVHVRITSQYNSKLSVLIVISCDICGMECVDYRQLLNHKGRANCMMKKISGTLRPRKVLIKKHLQPLKTHQLYVNSNGLFECPSCQRTYKNRRRYRLHLATHSDLGL